MYEHRLSCARPHKDARKYFATQRGNNYKMELTSGTFLHFRLQLITCCAHFPSLTNAMNESNVMPTKKPHQFMRPVLS